MEQIAYSLDNPRLTRGEYWLLETVAEFQMPVRLLDDEEMDFALNKKGHGMARQLLIQTLSNLFCDGLIQAFPFGRTEELYIPSPRQIVAALDEKRGPGRPGGMYYCLTEKGGSIWEAFAAPEWNRFIDESYGRDEETLQDNIGCLISANEELLINYFEHGDLGEFPAHRDKVKWDILEPWNATYWKTIPVGHRVRFEYVPGYERTIHQETTFRMRRPNWYAWG